MEEIWKDVIGFEGLYQVSNMGRLKSISRTVYCRNNTTKFIPERIMKQAKYPKSSNPNDYYLGVNLCKQGKEKSYRVHILSQIQINNRKKTLGYFLNETDARDAYLSALAQNGLHNKYAIFE